MPLFACKHKVFSYKEVDNETEFCPDPYSKMKQKEAGKLSLDLGHPTYPSYEGMKSWVSQRIGETRTIPSLRVE